MERLKVIVLMAVVTVLTATLMGCGMPKLPPDYRDRPFVAEVSWHAGEQKTEATITVDGKGRMEMLLREPDFVEGILLVAEGERRVIRCGETELDGTGADTLFSVMELLVPIGERRGVCETEWKGERAMYVEIVGQEDWALYIEPDSGVPKAVCRGELAVEILSFAFLAEEGES